MFIYLLLNSLFSFNHPFRPLAAEMFAALNIILNARQFIYRFDVIYLQEAHSTPAPGGNTCGAFWNSFPSNDLGSAGKRGQSP